MPAEARPLICQRLLSPDAVKLGRFVVNMEEPYQDHHDPLLPAPTEVTETLQLDLISTRSKGTHSSVGAGLDPLASFSHNKSGNGHSSIATAKSTVHTLEQPRLWFRDALKQAGTRAWFEDAILAGYDTFLITGYQAVYDAQLSREGEWSHDHHMLLTAPVSAALAATGLALGFGVIPDPQVTGTIEKLAQAKDSHVAPGKQISAVQYRRVKFKWYSSRNLDKAALGKESRWKMQWDFRSQESIVNDVVEPLLSDDEGYDEAE